MTRWLGVAVITAVAIVLRWWLTSREQDDVWSRVHERAAAWPAIPTGVQPHAPLLGASRAGEATAHYFAAIAIAPREVNQVTDEPWVRVGETLPGDAAERLAPFRAALDELAAGAACERIDAGAFVARGVVGKGTRLPAVAAFAIRVDLAERRFDVALQRTADLLTFARDRMLLGLAIHESEGASAVARCCEAWDDAAIASLSAPQQRAFEELLQRLDDTLPPAGATNEEIRLVLDAALRDPRATDAVPQLLDLLYSARALPAMDAAWSVRRSALATAFDGMPGRESFASRMELCEYVRRKALTKIRMLRIALVHHLGEPPPVLADPFGDGALQVSTDGGGLRIVSRGEDVGRGQGTPFERRVRSR